MIEQEQNLLEVRRSAETLNKAVALSIIKIIPKCLKIIYTGQLSEQKGITLAYFFFSSLSVILYKGRSIYLTFLENNNRSRHIENKYHHLIIYLDLLASVVPYCYYSLMLPFTDSFFTTPTIIIGLAWAFADTMFYYFYKIQELKKNPPMSDYTELHGVIEIKLITMVLSILSLAAAGCDGIIFSLFLILSYNCYDESLRTTFNHTNTNQDDQICYRAGSIKLNSTHSGSILFIISCLICAYVTNRNNLTSLKNLLNHSDKISDLTSLPSQSKVFLCLSILTILITLTLEAIIYNDFLKHTLTDDETTNIFIAFIVIRAVFNFGYDLSKALKNASMLTRPRGNNSPSLNSV